jgi:hypothetical protein
MPLPSRQTKGGRPEHPEIIWQRSESSLTARAPGGIDDRGEFIEAGRPARCASALSEQYPP